MQVRNVFRSEADLMERFGKRFYERWQRLLCLYRDRKKLNNGVNVLKAASLAMAFYAAAVDGNATVIENFDDMLHGECQECLVIDDMPVRVDDEITACLVWDTAELMLDTNSSLPQIAQYAYDVVDKHLWLAYETDDNVVVDKDPVSREKTVKVEAKPINTAVPAFTEEQLAWMMQSAVDSGSREDAWVVRRIITKNIMERYHSEVASQLNDMDRQIANKLTAENLTIETNHIEAVNEKGGTYIRSLGTLQR